MDYIVLTGRLGMLRAGNTDSRKEMAASSEAI